MSTEIRLEEHVKKIEKKEESAIQHLSSQKNNPVNNEVLKSCRSNSQDELKAKNIQPAKEFSLIKSEPILDKRLFSQTDQKKLPITLEPLTKTGEKVLETQNSLKTPLKTSADIFKNKTSPDKETSSSAISYSSQFPLIPLKNSKKLDFFYNSETLLCSPRSSARSFDRNNPNNDTFNLEKNKKYINSQELKNIAHEEFLALKEQMLNEKEKFLNEKEKKIQKLLKNQKYLSKPPRSPRLKNSKTQLFISTKKLDYNEIPGKDDYLCSKPGIPDHKIHQIVNYFKTNDSPFINTKKPN